MRVCLCVGVSVYRDRNILGLTDGRTDKMMDGCKDGRTDGEMEGNRDGRMGECVVDDIRQQRERERESGRRPHLVIHCYVPRLQQFHRNHPSTAICFEVRHEMATH